MPTKYTNTHHQPAMPPHVRRMRGQSDAEAIQSAAHAGQAAEQAAQLIEHVAHLLPIERTTWQPPLDLATLTVHCAQLRRELVEYAMWAEKLARTLAPDPDPNPEPDPDPRPAA